MTEILKPDAGLLVVREDENGVSIETFRISKNILTPDEAKEQGLTIVNPNSSKKIGVWCGGISERFKDYIIQTTAKRITSFIKKVEKEEDKLRKGIWVSIVRQLNKYTNEELQNHYETGSQEWRDWCNDAVLFFVYNAVIFKKGIPSIELSAEQKASAK